MKALAGLAISFLCVTPAAADCGAAKVVDRCAVGTWLYEGNVSDLLNAVGLHKPYLRVENATMSKLQLLFRANGTFATNPMDMRLAMVSGRETLSVHISMQTNGTWAADGGVMNRCVGPSSHTTAITELSGYPPHTYSPPSPASIPSFSSYTCNAHTLTIVQSVAHHLPVVLRYRRSH